MKKIMFNDKYGLTGAVLDGHKTMTRRIIPDKIIEASYRDVSWETVHLELTGEQIDLLTDKAVIARSYYKVGDIVAVAQNLKDMGYNPRDTRHRSGEIWGLDHCTAWTNKMFVYASECKHHIRITDIRIERLLDISDDDCIKEGIQALRIPDGWRYVAGGSKICEPDRNRIWSGELKLSEKCAFNSPYAAFADLFDRVSGKGSWDKNPLVYVYSFELMK